MPRKAAGNESARRTAEEVRRLLSAHAPEAVAFLRERLAECCPDATVTTDGLREEDWAENWKKYYHPIPFGRLTVVPAWEDYTAAEAERILAYLKSGGHMLFIASAECASMPNIKSITEYYGFTLTSDTVLEDKAVEEGEEAAVSDTLTITLNIDHDVFATVGANTVSLIPPTAIEISDSLRPAQLVTPLLTSTSKAYIKNSEATAPFTLGVAVEEESDAGNTKIVCLATASSINTDELTQAAITLPVCALSWMAEGFSNTVSEVAPKIYQDKPINIEQKQGLYFGAVFGIIAPAALITIGAVLTKNRKKR